MFVPKVGNILPSSMSKLTGKNDFKGMRYPVHIIISALSMFYLGKDSFRNIALILIFHNLSLELMPMLDFNSSKWHADETVVKVNGKKYYVWFILDSNSFVLGFHLSSYRNSCQAFTLLNPVKGLGDVDTIVSDRYSAYKIPVKSVPGSCVKHIRVESFKDEISNNLIESFHHQFKAWYKTKQGFNSFESANNLISMLVFSYNFVRPHSSLRLNSSSSRWT